MQAYVRTDATDQNVELAEVPAPAVDADEVLIAVHAFGVGVHDRYFIPQGVSFPYVIGLEAAGVVAETGAGVTGIDVGARVMVTSVGNPKGGTWAPLVAVNPRRITVVPDGLDLVTAAAIPIAGDAAVESLHTLGMRSGQTLFVAGASGAIGTLVVQVAAQRGVRVAGSASPANHDYLRSLGAELAVDYGDPTWTGQVRAWAADGVDAALAIQPGTPAPSLQVVRDDGHLVTVSGDPCPSERGIHVEQFPHRADTSSDMADLVADISTGRTRMVIEHVYPFQQALTALEKVETRHARGKLVVTRA
ncbi:MAG: NADP-dependent oxidoreductase [Microlunatus sp.]|nr:NADP-dependent oxidoreductase [Microlunatus sp.]MDN5769407.1 NADP-dependent oxidoreductase [Microlunatus sp.]